MAKKVMIDAGHGPNTLGKRAPDDSMREFHFNKAVADLVIAELNRYKNVVVRAAHDSTGRRDVPLRERTNKANAWGADLYVSIHANALKDSWSNAKGIETFVHPNSSASSRRMANLLQTELIKATGLVNRGVKTANFHVLRVTKMPAVLSENGFMDNRDELKLLKSADYRKKVADAHVKAIVQFLGLSGKSKAAKPAKPAAPTKPAKSGGSVGGGGGSVVDYMKANGMDSSFANRKRLAAKYGIKNYTGTASQNVALLNKLKGGKPAPAKTKYPLPSGVLRRGVRGENVKQLQRALNAAGFKCGNVDGIYGAKTEDAVRRFQKVHDAYNVDGVYGPRTRDRLNKKVN